MADADPKIEKKPGDAIVLEPAAPQSMPDEGSCPNRAANAPGCVRC